MKRIYILTLNIILVFISNLSVAQGTLNIIPKPNNIKVDNGYYIFGKDVKVVVNNQRFKADVDIFSHQIFKLFGYSARMDNFSDDKADIVILDDSIIPFEGYHFTSQDASYSMLVTPHNIKIWAHGAGVLYSLETLAQMINKDRVGNMVVPCCTIMDEPAFKWRGMHLDVCRHFFPKDSIKSYLDVMAFYKMNVFHWHLTDDQGWRIEIKKYPKLTMVGSVRNETIVGKHFNPFKGDNTPYGGFYSQNDITEIVQYAAERHITIVPEIEMPGHCQAALAAYPAYSTTGGPFEVMTTWGESADVFIPTKETFKFIEDILTEVMALFPGKYIHIGGDEVSKTQWQKSAFCQAFMKVNGLKNEEALQSFFIRHIDSFITAKGRATIGWDEILEGGIAPNAAIMSWRGTEGGKAAARLHHHVVMCPGEYCYFDHYQGSPTSEPLAIGGYTDVEKVYSYNPIPEALTEDQQAYIMGAQGNVWTEYISTFAHAQYMALPRMCALSEVLWTKNNLRDYNDFKLRLLKHFDYLDKFKIHYATSMLDPQAIVSPGIAGHALKVTFKQCTPACKMSLLSKTMTYTIAQIMKDSILNIDTTCKADLVSCLNGKIMGTTVHLNFYINKATGKNIVLDTPPNQHYASGGAFKLLDGIQGSVPWYGKDWLGWSGNDCIATIDLGKVQDMNGFKVGMLEDRNSWIYASTRIEVWTSRDNKKFDKISDNQLTDQNEGICRNYIGFTRVKLAHARYVKFKIHNFGKIPEGYPGAGNKSWLFIDEIELD